MFLKNEQIILEYPKENLNDENIVKVDETLIPAGDVLVKEERYEEAAELYHQALVLCPNHIYAQLRKADALLNHEKIDEALRCYYQLIEHQEKDDSNIVKYTGLVRLGLIFLYQRPDYSKAAHYFNQALQMKPNDHVALCYRGEAYYHIENYAEAAQDFRDCLRVEPHYPLALILLAKSLYKQGLLDPARELFDRILVKDPNDIYALQCRGYIYRKQRCYTQALSDFNHVLTLNPNDVLTLDRRADILLNCIGNSLGAYFDATRALQIEPHNLTALEYRYRALIKLGRFDEALKDIEQCLSISSTNITHKEQKAWVLYEKHQYELALQELVQLRQLNAENHNYVDLSRLIHNRLKPAVAVTSNNAHYRKGERRNSVFSTEGRLMIPSSNQSIGGLSGSTRLFFEVGDELKQPKKVVKSPHSRVFFIEMFQEECKIWNLFYPEHPAVFFNFNNKDCRLVLPFFPGKTLSRVGHITTIEWLQIGLSAALELDRFHKVCGCTHSDFKADNILVDRYNSNPLAPFNAHLIDFGLSDTIGEMIDTYNDKKSTHIAPEKFGLSGRVIVKTEQDVYSFSSEMLRIANYVPNELYEHLKTGCAPESSSRPTLYDLINRFWLVLLNRSLHSAQSASSFRGDMFLSQFLKSLNGHGARVLLDIIDQHDTPLQNLIRRYPVLIDEIVSRYRQHQAELQSIKKFVLELYQSTENMPSGVSTLTSHSMFQAPAKASAVENAAACASPS